MSYALKGKILSILPMRGKYYIMMQTELGNFELTTNNQMLLNIWISLGKKVTGNYTLEKVNRELLGEQISIVIDF